MAASLSSAEGVAEPWVRELTLPSARVRISLSQPSEVSAAPLSLWTLTPSSNSHTSPSVAGATRMLPSAIWPLRR